MATAAPDRSRQYVQRRVNLHQGKITNLDTRAAAIEDSVRSLAALPSSKAVVKRLDGQYNPNLCFDELRENDSVTVIPVITSLAENYPERKPSTSYKLRHSVVANYADEPFDDNGKQHPRFLPVMGRTFSLQSEGPVDWSQGLKDGYVQIGKQSLVLLGELKGPWQPATQYKFGDNVIVRANYAPFMGMPAGQTQLFVFSCVRDHTSGDLASYIGFWDLGNDYLDASGFPTVPRDDVDFGTDNIHWRLCRYNRVRQFWPWNPTTNSVQATLFTDQMDELRYPVHVNPADSYLLNTTSSNVPHALFQEQGVIALADGRLTLWHSNWWKAQSVKSGSGALTFPLRAGSKRHIIDGDILWRRTDEHRLYANILLPIDSRIKPFCKLTLLPYSRVHHGMNIEMVNLTGSHISETNPTSSDGPDGQQSTTFIFDSLRGHWVIENT